MTPLYAYGIRVSVDKIAQEPTLEQVVLDTAFVKTGTSIRIRWCKQAGLKRTQSRYSYKSEEDDHEDEDPMDDFYGEILNLLQSYASFNPHAGFRLCRDGKATVLLISISISVLWFICIGVWDTR